MPRVLIVDDEINLRENLAVFLEDEGMDVSTVESGEDAIQSLLSGEHFDVCIMDMRLPGIDGNDTIRALRRIDSKLRFIVHTGTAGYSVPEDLRNAGITYEHVFTKPVTDMTPLADTVVMLSASHGDVE